jgi:hypothetical protein
MKAIRRMKSLLKVQPSAWGSAVSAHCASKEMMRTRRAKRKEKLRESPGDLKRELPLHPGKDGD